jgi:glycosyltransferase involved in cell wall biosynthesis
MYCNQLPPWWRGARPWFDAVVLPRASSLVWRILYEQLWFPLALASGMHTLFCPGYVGSAMLRTRQVVAVLDAYAWRYPREIGRLKSLYWKFLIPRSIRGRNEVTTISSSSAQDIVRFCKADLARIHVIYPAGGHLAAMDSDNGVLGRLGLDPLGFFHCVGVFKEIKNPSRILDAYQRYAEQAGPERAKKLVLVGRADGEFAEKLQARAEGMPGVVLAGRLTDAELAALYRGSAALVFPSLYEGFGIPILEAQSLSCPVITSNVSSMPEVAGAGAILVDPESIDAIAEALLTIHDPSRRAALIAQGLDNFVRFSWQKASDEVLALLSAESRGT